MNKELIQRGIAAGKDSREAVLTSIGQILAIAEPILEREWDVKAEDVMSVVRDIFDAYPDSGLKLAEALLNEDSLAAEASAHELIVGSKQVRAILRGYTFGCIIALKKAVKKVKQLVGKVF